MTDKPDIDFQGLCWLVDRPEPWRVRVKLYLAPGRAPEACRAFKGAGLRPRVASHNCIYFYRPADVAGFLLRTKPSHLMRQAAIEYEQASASKDRPRQEQAARAVLSYGPPPAIGVPRQGRPYKELI